MSSFRPVRLTLAGCAIALSIGALTACSSAAGTAAESAASPEPSPSVVVTTESTATESTDSESTGRDADCDAVLKAMNSVDGMDDPTALTAKIQSDPASAPALIRQLSTALSAAADEVADNQALAGLTTTAADAYGQYGDLLNDAVTDPAGVDTAALLQSVQDATNATLEISKLCATAE